METGVYQIEFKDGRIYRIFFANGTQKKKIIQSYHSNQDQLKSIDLLSNGIHSVSEWERQINHENWKNS
jgi:hypothetical protein